MGRIHNGTPTILVADDDDDGRSIMRRVLERQGYHVLEALTGIEALEIALSEQPDLILMDINLPRIDGINATRQIRQTEKMSEVPVVAMSGYESVDLRDAAHAAGCVEYLTKPIEIDDLEHLVDRLLPIKV